MKDVHVSPIVINMEAARRKPYQPKPAKSIEFSKFGARHTETNGLHFNQKKGLVTNPIRYNGKEETNLDTTTESTDFQGQEDET